MFNDITHVLCNIFSINLQKLNAIETDSESLKKFYINNYMCIRSNKIVESILNVTLNSSLLDLAIVFNFF